MKLILAIGLGIIFVIIVTALWKRHGHGHSTDNSELLESFIQRKQLLHIYVGYPLHKPVWYGVEADQWIQPGETVTDWDNYGGRGRQGIWAYFCEDEDGKEFIAAVSFPGK